MPTDMVKTTINIRRSYLKTLKIERVKRDRSLESLLDEALESYFEQRYITVEGEQENGNG